MHEFSVHGGQSHSKSLMKGNDEFVNEKKKEILEKKRNE